MGCHRAPGITSSLPTLRSSRNIHVNTVWYWRGPIPRTVQVATCERRLVACVEARAGGWSDAVPCSSILGLEAQLPVLLSCLLGIRIVPWFVTSCSIGFSTSHVSKVKAAGVVMARSWQCAPNYVLIQESVCTCHRQPLLTKKRNRSLNDNTIKRPWPAALIDVISSPQTLMPLLTHKGVPATFHFLVSKYVVT